VGRNEGSEKGEQKGKWVSGRDRNGSRKRGGQETVALRQASKRRSEKKRTIKKSSKGKRRLTRKRKKQKTRPATQRTCKRPWRDGGVGGKSKINTAAHQPGPTRGMKNKTRHARRGPLHRSPRPKERAGNGGKKSKTCRRRKGRRRRRHQKHWKRRRCKSKY